VLAERQADRHAEPLRALVRAADGRELARLEHEVVAAARQRRVEDRERVVPRVAVEEQAVDHDRAHALLEPIAHAEPERVDVVAAHRVQIVVHDDRVAEAVLVGDEAAGERGRRERCGRPRGADEQLDREARRIGAADGARDEPIGQLAAGELARAVTGVAQRRGEAVERRVVAALEPDADEVVGRAGADDEALRAIVEPVAEAAVRVLERGGEPEHVAGERAPRREIANLEDQITERETREHATSIWLQSWSRNHNWRCI
jgi:hypothetical protein